MTFRSNLSSPGFSILLCLAAGGCGGTLDVPGDDLAGGGGNGGNGGNGGAGGAQPTGGNADGGAQPTGGNGDGGNADGAGGTGGGDTNAPLVVSTIPVDLADDQVTNINIAVTFNEEMDADTISDTTFILTQDGTTIDGDVTYAGVIATLNPLLNLELETEYVVTVTTDVTDLAGNPLTTEETWSFVTGPVAANGPAPVDLGDAGDFVILAKSGIDTVPTSLVVGDIGVSPIDATALTGFSLMLDPSATFALSSQLVGRAYAANYTAPTPANLIVAVNDMETAYTDAAGRTTPDFTNLGAGELGGLTMVPGLYKWTTGVTISTDMTLDGGPSDIWIFQIAGGITEASNVEISLSGGALAKNIFWQTAGAFALDTGATFAGVVLSQTEITLATGASVNGRLLSQTAVTLDASTVTQPSP